MRSTSEAIAIGIEAEEPILVWGGPGTGKTSFGSMAALSLERHNESVIPALRDQSDFGGLPYITPDGVRLEAPAWAKRLLAEDTAGRESLLTIDEINGAAPAVQSALLRVIFERVIGEQPRLNKCAMLAMANPTSEAANGWELAPPLANRFCHIYWAVDTQEWIEGMLNGWPVQHYQKLPKNWREGIQSVRGEIAGFIRTRADLLYAMPKEDSRRSGAWPSPRTWDMASRLITACRSINLGGSDAETILISGCVGEGPAMEFIAWRSNLDLPDPEDLLKSPEKFKVPNRGDKVFVILAGLVTAVKQQTTKARWLASWDILQKVAEANMADIAAFSAQTLIRMKRGEWPLPKEALQAFGPTLKAAGLIS